MTALINVTARGVVSGGGANPAAVQTDLATALAAFDTAAASIIAITGDTYVAHQFVTGGATGLTHGQWATQAALINTALAAVLACIADGVDDGGDVSVCVNNTNFQTKGQLIAALREAATTLSQMLGIK